MFSKFTTRKKFLLETGFSMLEAVVVIGVLLALAIGGFLAYGSIAANAKMAHTADVASQVHTAVLVASSDGNPETSGENIISGWNASTDQIRVELLSAATSSSDACVKATWLQDETITANRGSCTAAAPAEPAAPEPNVGFMMMSKVNLDFDNNRWPDEGSPAYRIVIVDQTSGKTVWDWKGSTSGSNDLSHAIEAPASQMPIYKFTVTTANGTYSFTTTADDWVEGHTNSYQMEFTTWLNSDGFTRDS